MSAKHKRPFYVFAGVAAICGLVLVTGIRGSKADDGGPPAFVTAPIAGVESSSDDLADAPASRPDPGLLLALDTMGGPGAGPGGALPTTPDGEPSETGVDGLENLLTSLGSGAFILPPPPVGLVPPTGDDPDAVTPPVTDDEVRSSGGKRRGHQNDDDKGPGKDEGDDEGGDEGDEGDDEATGDGSTETNVDPMSGDADPADGGQGEQDPGEGQGGSGPGGTGQGDPSAPGSDDQG